MSISIPAGLVTTGAGVPGVCAKHGEPATLHKSVKFYSKPPTWAYALIFLGALPFLIVTLVLRKELQSPAWPFCPQCQAQHKNRMIIGGVLVALLPISVVVMSVSPDAGAILVLLSFLAFFAGIIVLSRGTYRMLPWGFVAQDGSALDLPKAHPNFTAGAQAAYHQAAQQHAAWQAGQQAAYAQQQAGYQAPQQGGYPQPQHGGYPQPQHGGYQAPQQAGYPQPPQGGYQQPQHGGYQQPPQV